jgi:hypothetical protein
MEECSLMQVDRCFSPAMRPLRNGGVVKFLEIGSGQACCMQKSHVPVHANNDHRQTTQTIRVHRLTCKIEGLWRTEEDVRTMYPDARSKLPLDRARKCRYQPIMSIDGVFVCGVDRGGWISDFDSSWHLQRKASRPSTMAASVQHLKSTRSCSGLQAVSQHNRPG